MSYNLLIFRCVALSYFMEIFSFWIMQTPPIPSGSMKKNMAYSSAGGNVRVITSLPFFPPQGSSTRCLCEWSTPVELAILLPCCIFAVHSLWLHPFCAQRCSSLPCAEWQKNSPQPLSLSTSDTNRMAEISLISQALCQMKTPSSGLRRHIPKYVCLKDLEFHYTVLFEN